MHDEIQIRYNGKFFTGPILAGSAKLAFESLVEQLVKFGHASKDRAVGLKAKGFKPMLRPAGESPLQFMWNRALAAEANNVHVIFSMYDHCGWRFFGRI
jgi:hypothetical protein